MSMQPFWVLLFHRWVLGLDFCLRGRGKSKCKSSIATHICLHCMHLILTSFYLSDNNKDDDSILKDNFILLGITIFFFTESLFHFYIT